VGTSTNSKSEEVTARVGEKAPKGSGQLRRNRDSTAGQRKKKEKRGQGAKKKTEDKTQPPGDQNERGKSLG